MTDATQIPIVLIHGFWVTPRSWENWITHRREKGTDNPPRLVLTFGP
jgi:hypothetical protein